MEIKEYNSKQWKGYCSNKKVSQKIPRKKWQWKHHDPKPMRCSKSSSKREIYNHTILSQEGRKTWNRQNNLTSKATGKRATTTTTTKKPKISRSKEIIKIKEINGKKWRKQ